MPSMVRTKRELILQAARELFLERGFAQTSMDAVTERARVSKPTVYAHFPSKQELLEAVVAEGAATAAAALEFPCSEDVQTDMEAAGNHLVDLLASPEGLAWDRMISAEAKRIPNVGQVFFDQGPGRLLEALSRVFEVHKRAGRLRITDVDQATQLFFGLLLGLPLVQSQLCPNRPSPAKQAGWVKEAVRVFLCAYGPGAMPQASRRGRIG